MAYIVDASNANAPLASDYSGPYTAEELRAIKAYYLAQFSTINSNLATLNLNAGSYLKKSGDISTGQLKVPLIPSTNESAVPKKYVDDLAAAILSGLSGASLNASMFAGLKVDSNYSLILDYGVGDYKSSDYGTYDFIPVNATFVISSSGQLIMTF